MGDAATRRCVRCKEDLSFESFYGGNTKHVDTSCKKCRCAVVRAARKENPQKFRAAARRRYLRTKEAYYRRQRDYRLRFPIKNKKQRAAYYAENKTMVDQTNRKNHLFRKYSITPEDYQKLVSIQGGACGICGGEKPNGRSTNWNVDHDHSTNRVRGLLCTGCNRILGRIEKMGVGNIEKYLNNPPAAILYEGKD